MKPALHRLIGFAIQSLPDSIAERKMVLGDILSLLPPKHPSFEPISEMRRWLIAQERHQLNLALDFKNSAQSASQPENLKT